MWIFRIVYNFVYLSSVFENCFIGIIGGPDCPWAAYDLFCRFVEGRTILELCSGRPDMI